MELEEVTGGTQLRLTHLQLPSEESRERHGEGWRSLLDKLEQFVDRSRTVTTKKEEK